MSPVYKLVTIAFLLMVVGLSSSYVSRHGKEPLDRNPSSHNYIYSKYNGLKRPWGRSTCYKATYRDHYSSLGYRECRFPADYPFETIVGVALLIGIGVPIYRRFRIKARSAELIRRLEKLSVTDPKWGEQFICESVAQKFMILTQAWAKLDIETVRPMVHPTLSMEWEMQFQNSYDRGEYHELKGLTIQSIDIVNFKNFQGENQDQVTACVHAKVHDTLLRKGIILTASEEVYQEFWTFLWNQQVGWIPLQVHRVDEWEKIVEGKVINQSPINRKSS